MSAAGFDDVTFPLPFALGASGGPEWRTEIITLDSGAEVRNGRWSASRRRWDLGSAVATVSDLETLSRFFEARQGRLRGFRLPDPLENSSANLGQPPGPADQVIGIGDGETDAFQLAKVFGAVSKPVTKPRPGSVRIAIGGSELGAGWSVDPLTGIVTFDAAPASGAAITAGFRFDWPVRFDTDHLDITHELVGAGRAVSLPVIELL